MSGRKQRIVKTALLSAAATALTVKGALAGPLGVVAAAPLDKLKRNVEEKRQQALTQSRNALDQAGARLVGGIVPALPTGSPPAPPRRGARQAEPSDTDPAAERRPAP